ncbi:hypothetical protein VNI00_006405 [Paramarasmius palmivorus]|uniref:DUF6699 domain-containing protein n=1 Tax=Paramarasmius palmivorus TaxID=297713 RepID=A0AAW0D9J3_9AGAR
MSHTEARPTARSLPRHVSFSVETQTMIIPANFLNNVDEQHRQNVTAPRETGPWVATTPVSPNVSDDFSPTYQAYYHSSFPQTTIDMAESLTAQPPRPTASSANLATWSSQRGPQAHQSAVAPSPHNPNPLSPPVDAQRHHRPQAIGQPYPYHGAQAYSSAQALQYQYPNPLKYPSSFTNPLTTSTTQVSNAAITSGRDRQATDIRLPIEIIHEFLRKDVVSPLIKGWDVGQDPAYMFQNVRRERPGLLQETAVLLEGTLVIQSEHVPWELKLEPEDGRMLTVEVFLRKLYLSFQLHPNEVDCSSHYNKFRERHGSAALHVEMQRVEEERRRRVAETRDDSDSVRIIDFLRFRRFRCLDVRTTCTALKLSLF